MPHPRATDSSPRRGMTRRGLLAAGGGTALAALLGACGDDSGAASPAGGGSAAPGGAWSFADDQPKTLTAAAVPARIVAFTGTAAALADFGLADKIVGVFGETKLADGAKHPQAGDLDITKVTILGNAWGEFSVEQYAALRPELLVTHMYDPGAVWYVPDESKDKILALAPAALITTGRVPMTTPIERYAALAKSLGADLQAPKVVQAKARFEQAEAALKQAIAAHKGLKVLAASASADLFYASNPKVSTDLMYWAGLGLDIIVPDKLDEGGYFESLSWENADKYQADLILLDNRNTALQPAALTAKPTWKDLPAVKANQLTGWDTVPRFSYAGAAPLLENLTKAVQAAKKLT